MEAKEAKAKVAGWIKELGLGELRLTAKTVDFSDLARGSTIFVKVHGWTPNPKAQNLEDNAKAHGFRVEFSRR